MKPVGVSWSCDLITRQLQQPLSLFNRILHADWLSCDWPIQRHTHAHTHAHHSHTFHRKHTSSSWFGGSLTADDGLLRAKKCAAFMECRLQDDFSSIAARGSCSPPLCVPPSRCSSPAWGQKVVFFFLFFFLFLLFLFFVFYPLGLCVLWGFLFTFLDIYILSRRVDRGFPVNKISRSLLLPPLLQLLPVCSAGL